MNESLELIQKLAEERLTLYRLAGHQHLTPPQMQRLDELTGRLTTMWDEHRRELSNRYYQPYQYAPRRDDAARAAFNAEPGGHKAA